MIRRAAVAGQFYPASMDALMKDISSMAEAGVERSKAAAVVCPHAGITYSGKVAAAVYSRIETPATYVVLGPDHHGIGSDFTLMTEGEWETPMGHVRVDSDLAREIYKRSKWVKDEPFAHEREHSIELQLPFMQYFGDGFEFVPLMMHHYSPDEDYLSVCEEIGQAVGRAAKEYGGDVTVVASTDFSHYVPGDVAKEADQYAMDAILSIDPALLFERVKEKNISMCGYGPVAAALYAAKIMGAEKAELVKYMNSGDVTGDQSAVVGYGGLRITC